MLIYPHKAVLGWDGDNGIGDMLIQQITDGKKQQHAASKKNIRN